MKRDVFAAEDNESTSVKCTGGAATAAQPFKGLIGGAHGGPHGGPMGPHGAPMGPIWGGIAPPGGHMGPLGPYGADLPPSPPGQLQRSSQGRFFPARKPLFLIFGPKNGPKKKLRLRGWDLSGEIRSGILCKTPPRLSKTVGWRPISSQIGVILGPLGFRPQLAHPYLAWPGGGPLLCP